MKGLDQAVLQIVVGKRTWEDMTSEEFRERMHGC